MQELNRELDIVNANSRLNEQEFREKKIALRSYPRSIFLQMDAPCNQDCLFCSRPESYGYFRLDEFREKYEKKLQEALARAEKLLLTGSGELLALPEAKKNLGYFNEYKYSEKMFATNGSTLTPKMVDFIVESGNRYTIHISIHSTNQDMHRVMTKSDSYGPLMENLKYIRDIKKNARNLTVNFIFLVTTKNVEQLPGFLDFAGEYSADGVIAYYNYVYRSDQKELSSYFAKERTNKALDAAREKAARNGLKLRLSLPPKYNEDRYAGDITCGEAWSQIMINPQGDIITCDIAGDSKETLSDKNFMEAWNGKYFTDIRFRLASGDRACSKTCFRANPSIVNDFRSHVITRGKTEEEIELFLKK